MASDACPRCGSRALTEAEGPAHGAWRHLVCRSCGLDFWHRDVTPEVRCPVCGRPMAAVLMRGGEVEAWDCGACGLTLRKREA